MAEKIPLIRNLNSLVGANNFANEHLQSIPLNTVVMATITKPRNIKHFKKYWAIWGVLKRAGILDEEIETIRKDIKRKYGHYDLVPLPDGSKAIDYHSCSLSSMDQDTFSRHYEETFNYLCKRYGIEANELKREAQAEEE